MTEALWKKANDHMYVECPQCHNVFVLDHEVDRNGVITPSLDCPLCPFHESGVMLHPMEGLSQKAELMLVNRLRPQPS